MIKGLNVEHKEKERNYVNDLGGYGTPYLHYPSIEAE